MLFFKFAAAVWLGMLLRAGTRSGSNLESARKLGLNVDLDSYDKLAHYPEYFDCIVCSHVIEHVHSPLELLQKLYSALKPGGTLLSVPNSVVKLVLFLGHFGAGWKHRDIYRFQRRSFFEIIWALWGLVFRNAFSIHSQRLLNQFRFSEKF